MKIKFEKIPINYIKTNLLIKQMTCTSCNSCVVKPIINKYFGVCEICDARNFFIKFDSVQSFILDNLSEKKYIYGSYNNGKTTLSAFSFFRHLITIPGSHILAISNTLKQLAGTAKKELLKFFLKEDFIVFNEDRWELDNGSTISWLVSDVEKLKSYNSSGTWAIEVNNIPEKILQILESRIRLEVINEYKKDSDGKIIYSYDKNGNQIPTILYRKSLSIYETNPDRKAVRKLSYSKKIYYSDNVNIKTWKLKIKNKEVKDINQSSFLCSVLDSYHPSATKEYKDDLKIGRDEKEYETMINCNYPNSSLRLFPEIENTVMDSIDITYDGSWVFYVTDFGTNKAHTTLLTGIYNPDDQRIHFVDYYEDNEGDARYHGEIFPKLKLVWKRYKDVGHGCDIAGKKAIEGLNKNVIDIYRQNGIIMKPIPKNMVNKKIPINTLNIMINDDKIRIHSNCTELINNMIKAEYRITKDGDKKIPGSTKNYSDDSVDTILYFIQAITNDYRSWPYFTWKTVNKGYYNNSGQFFPSKNML